MQVEEVQPREAEVQITMTRTEAHILRTIVGSMSENIEEDLYYNNQMARAIHSDVINETMRSLYDALDAYAE